MRISDWSSDVCSSDLAVRSYRVSGAGGREHLPGQMAEDALIDEAPDDRPFAAPPFIIVMVTRHDMGRLAVREIADTIDRSEEQTSELQSLMRISYAVFCLNKTKLQSQIPTSNAVPSITNTHQ